MADARVLALAAARIVRDLLRPHQTPKKNPLDRPIACRKTTSRRAPEEYRGSGPVPGKIPKFIEGSGEISPAAGTAIFNPKPLTSAD